MRLVPSGLVLLDHLRRHAATVGQLDPVGRRPGTDGLQIHLCVAVAVPAGAARGAPAASPTGCLHPRLKCATELLGVRLAEVQLVGGAVQGERDGFIRLGAISVIFKDDQCLLGAVLAFL